MVTGGIFVATYASNPTSAVDGKVMEAISVLPMLCRILIRPDQDPLQEQDWTHFIEWCIGISMLIFALVMSAFLGALQVHDYSRTSVCLFCSMKLFLLQEHTYEELGVKKSDVPWQVCVYLVVCNCVPPEDCDYCLIHRRTFSTPIFYPFQYSSSSPRTSVCIFQYSTSALQCESCLSIPGAL